MGQLIVPDRVTLVVCPNEDGHKKLEQLRVGSGENKRFFYLVRVIWTQNGVENHYLDPPVGFALAILARYRLVNPPGLIAIVYKPCARCQGFDFSALYRKKYRDNPEPYNPND